MSTHVCSRAIYVAYSPSEDPKWRPEDMKAKTWYAVWGYENGMVKYKDGGAGEAFYFHFIGEGARPCRLLQGNAVIALDVPPSVFPEHGARQTQDEKDFPAQ